MLRDFVSCPATMAGLVATVASTRAVTCRVCIRRATSFDFQLAVLSNSCGKWSSASEDGACGLSSPVIRDLSSRCGIRRAGLCSAPFEQPSVVASRSRQGNAALHSSAKTHNRNRLLAKCALVKEISNEVEAEANGTMSFTWKTLG
jgi:hypothetical protein